MLTLSDDPLLVDKFPPTDPHNLSARILRLGLSVNAFASLERYVEGCFDYMANSLTRAPIPYSNFPTELREFLTIKAVEGLATRGNFVPDADRLAYFEQHIPDIAKYSQTPPVFTALGFSSRGSNVAASDIANGFKVFRVKKPWATLASITSAIGYSSVDIHNDFLGLAKTRHRSAHNPQANLPSSDLKNNLRAAIAIAIAVDVLTRRLADVWRVQTRLSDIAPAITSLSYPFRFVDEEGGGSFIERSTSRGRVTKRYTSEAAAVAKAALRATKNFIVIRDVAGRPLGLADVAVGPSAL